MTRESFLGVTAILAVMLASYKTSAAELPPPSQWMPQDSAVALEVSKPLALLDGLLRPELAKALAASASGQTPNLKLQQLQGIVAYLELQLNTDWRTGLRELVGQGLALGLRPGGAALLVADGQNEKMLRQLQETIRNFAAGQANKQGQPDRVSSREYRGATAWTFGPKESHVLVNTRLLVANGSDCIDRALDLRAEPDGRSLAASSWYQQAKEATGPETVATAFFNLQVLRQDAKVKQALANDGNPLPMLLLADIKEALRHANWLAIGVYVEGEKLVLKGFTDGKSPESSKAAAFASPGKEAGILPNLRVPGGIAGLSLYRDLRQFYSAKDDLFPERTSGLVFFENMMGIFFSGIDLTEGVLGETRPELRVVVAAQRYDPAIGTPTVQVPAFAAVLRLRHPQQFGEVVEEAWQKAIGLANFTRGQNALPGLIIDRAMQGDTKYTLSYYRPPQDKEKTAIDSRYNYRPSLARPGDYVVISSTDGLARDLIDALRQEANGSRSTSRAAHSLLELDGPSLRAILLANREHIVRKNMVDKGNSREQAEGEAGFFLAALDCLNRAVLSLNRQDGRPQAQLELKFKMPGGKAEDQSSKSGGSPKPETQNRPDAPEKTSSNRQAGRISDSPVLADASG